MAGIKSIKNNRICVIDGYKLYGTPRVADGLIEIGKCLHPNYFEIKENVQMKQSKNIYRRLNFQRYPPEALKIDDIGHASYEFT
jgi:hypothetical protein